MITLEHLVDILNSEITEEFLVDALDSIKENGFSIDTDNEDVMEVIETIADLIAESGDLCIGDDY